jgi:RHS repeat-associated protein
MINTEQSYSYDGLYQLTGVQGTSRSHIYGGNEEYRTKYKQDYSFNRIGNMMSKISEEQVSNSNRIGAPLNYSLDYEYYPGTHKSERIGTRYYDYDLNGNISVEREGGHAVTAVADTPYYQEGDRYWAEYGFGLVKPKTGNADDGVYQRNYKWNERNLLSETRDMTYTVQYRYGADGQRALKFTANSGRSTVYFNKMWQTSDARVDWVQGKHIYLNEDRIATKYNSEGNDNTGAEKERTYYYHSDHLGSAQVVTNWNGQIHERLEYTPYGELWIDWKGDSALEDSTPFRFTGKEMDAETGFYYYGARYLDPKTSRWISADPALAEYVPSAPVDEEAKKRNGNLPGQGGVFNYVNLHVYHYAGNNPVKYTDPDGRITRQQNFERNKYQNGYAPSNRLRMQRLVGVGLFRECGNTGTHNLTKEQDNPKGRSESVTRKNGSNIDYRGTKGTIFEGMQFVYSKLDDQIVLDSVNKGTFDFKSPYKDILSHRSFDVIPWIEWGNGPADIREDVIMSKEIWAKVDSILNDFENGKIKKKQAKEEIQSLFPPPPPVPKDLKGGTE